MIVGCPVSQGSRANAPCPAEAVRVQHSGCAPQAKEPCNPGYRRNRLSVRTRYAVPDFREPRPALYYRRPRRSRPVTAPGVTVARHWPTRVVARRPLEFRCPPKMAHERVQPQNAPTPSARCDVQARIAGVRRPRPLPAHDSAYGRPERSALNACRDFRRVSDARPTVTGSRPPAGPVADANHGGRSEARRQRSKEAVSADRLRHRSGASAPPRPHTACVRTIP